jgi:hypothetical protein
MEKVKRIYAKPTILRVQLSHEQAVLSACSTLTGALSGGLGTLCEPPSGFNCRKSSSMNSWDSMSTS